MWNYALSLSDLYVVAFLNALGLLWPVLYLLWLWGAYKRGG